MSFILLFQIFSNICNGAERPDLENQIQILENAVNQNNNIYNRNSGDILRDDLPILRDILAELRNLLSDFDSNINDENIFDFNESKLSFEPLPSNLNDTTPRENFFVLYNLGDINNVHNLYLQAQLFSSVVLFNMANVYYKLGFKRASLDLFNLFLQSTQNRRAFLKDFNTIKIVALFNVISDKKSHGSNLESNIETEIRDLNTSINSNFYFPATPVQNILSKIFHLRRLMNIVARSL